MSTTAEPKKLAIKIVGLGGAGCNVVKHMAATTPMPGVEFVLVNSEAIDGEVPAKKVLIGEAITHGLGTGGDPDVGRAIALAQNEEIKSICSATDIVFLVTGLGGGLATGAAPIFAQTAKQSGALVLAVATLPFDFEGMRRQRQAQQGFQLLKAAADVVLSLPNQKLLDVVNKKSTAVEAFNFSRELLAESIRGIWRLATQDGLVKVDFASLCAVTKGRHMESSFASVTAEGEGRANQLITMLFSHPFVNDQKLLKESEAVLVNIVSGPELTMDEVNAVMEPVNERCPNAHIVFGVAVDEAVSGKLSVTFIVSRRGKSSESEHDLEDRPTSRIETKEFDTQFHEEPTVRPNSRFVAPAPTALPDENKEKLLKRSRTRGRKKILMQQGQLPLEIVSRGRFEKSEPTIHQGEDLDVPTYLRRGTVLN